MRRGLEQWEHWDLSTEPHLNIELCDSSPPPPLSDSDCSQLSQMILSWCKLVIIYGWVMMELTGSFFNSFSTLLWLPLDIWIWSWINVPWSLCVCVRACACVYACVCAYVSKHGRLASLTHVVLILAISTSPGLPSLPSPFFTLASVFSRPQKSLIDFSAVWGIIEF